MARGKPKNPAPVSGPGALSRRTDGGPGSQSQPLRVPTGGGYGEAQALENQQKAAPLATAPSSGSPAQTPPVSGGAPAPIDVFAPTNRPNEPGMLGAAGAPLQADYTQDDAQTLLKILYSKYPHPQLLRMIRRR